jgi:ribonuclease HII
VQVRIDGLPFTLDSGGRPVEFIVKGDLHDWYIGAGSIVAKTVRDGVMAKWATLDAYRGYGWDQNSGYGTKAHANAIRQLGLSDQHRKKFCRRYETPDTTAGILDLFKP